MEHQCSPKASALLLISMLLISSLTPILGCGSCKHKNPKGNSPPKGGSPITLPPIVKPPINLPPVTIPPVTVPPILNPPVTVPPILNPPAKTPKGKACPPPPGTCPIDTLKLGACVDLLGGLVHIGLGDPVVNQCCPVLKGLVELEAAVCLCTTLKLKLLNLNIYVPLALQLLITCGKTPPPGYTCNL
ncbi:36.4 kDa proline-rich protein [Malania oleifera]|uniref:36.4 kDa proline-rich protein n=1 Tax=Malania oleifera TaxID=397392 RepID=UPI0025ADD713|nr:36.4 kDa proline-rich protein [Malania oleifera]